MLLHFPGLFHSFCRRGPQDVAANAALDAAEAPKLTLRTNITPGGKKMRREDLGKLAVTRAKTTHLRAPLERPRGHRPKRFRDGLGVCLCHSTSSCFDVFRYSPVVYEHCEQVAPLHFFAEDGAHGKGVEGPNEFMKATLIIADGCRVAAISIYPRPVRDPAHHRGVPMQRAALQGFAGAEQFGQAVRRCQKDQSSTVQQGIGLEPGLTKTRAQCLSGRWALP